MSARARTWRTDVRSRLDEWMNLLLLLAIGCAGLLVLALVAPRELARTSWTQAGRDAYTVVNDSPAGYVGLVSLCGLVALSALVVAAWSQRARVPAVLLAFVAFAGAAWVAVRYQRLLLQGAMGLEGRLVASGGTTGGVDAPELLPLFVLAAVLGALLAVAYMVAWWPRRGERERW